MTLSYIKVDEVKEVPLFHHIHNLSYTASGYGSKLPTSKMARVGRRWHRIYCMCYSNSGTCYIIKGGERLIVDDCEVTA